MQRVLRSQADFRRTTLRNQLTSLILFESIHTTEARAKLLISFANRFFNRVKPADFGAHRLAHETLFDKNAVKKVFEEILPRYDAREVNFVRRHHILARRGDSSKMSLVALTHLLEIKESRDESPATAAKVAKKAAAKIESGNKKQ